MQWAYHPRARRALTRRAAPVVWLAACAALLLGCVKAQDSAAVVRPAADASQDDLWVLITDDLLTVRARDASVGMLLDEVARQSGLVVVSHAALAARITVKFERLPLREALEVILRDQSFTLQDVESLSREGNTSAARLRKLWVFSEGPKREPPSSRVASAGRLEDLDSFDAENLAGALSLALTDGDANVRADAVSTLAEIRDDQAAAALAMAALNDGDSSVRQEAVYTLGAIGGETGIRGLQQALIDSNPEIREAAIRAFADIGGDRSAMALAVVLNDGDASLRAEAVDALGEIRGETANQLLHQALADEQSYIRDDAAELLAEVNAD